MIDDDGHIVQGQNTGLYTPARAAPALAGHSRVTRDGDRLLAVVPVNGHTEKLAGVADAWTAPTSPGESGVHIRDIRNPDGAIRSS